MGSLFAALVATSDSLKAYDRQLSAIQNNVANASTPGFAKSRLDIKARPFDAQTGLAGGVQAGDLISTRDFYAERSVWVQSQKLGRYGELANQLAPLEASFSLQSGGVPDNLNKFFDSFSSLAVNPNSQVSRQLVLDRADAAVRSIRQNAQALGQAQADAERSVTTTVSRINALAGRLRDLNVELGSDARKKNDPALDAQIYSTLEQLSSLGNISVIRQPDSTYQVLLGGQTPLVIGSRRYTIQEDLSGGTAVIRDSQGTDITGQIGDGQLRAQLDLRNTILPQHGADLDKLAQNMADQVNAALAGGVDINGNTPTKDLFTYDPTVGASKTLAVNSALTTDDIAAALPGAEGGNGNALQLAALGRGEQIDGMTYSEYYGTIGQKFGRELSEAKDGQQLQAELTSQAKEIRQQSSGVSLDEEAARLVEAQRAYQANAKVFEVLQQLTDTVIGLLR